MDIVSHGLWGGAAFGRKNKKSFLIAFISGIGPDFFSFGVFFISTFLGVSERSRFSSEPPDPALIPAYVHNFYNVSHSLIVFAAVFVALWVIFRQPVWEFSAWGLHILFDIPTHSYQFFPTPFLWPISDFKINGWSWASPWIFFPNLVILALVYIWFIRAKKCLARKLSNAAQKEFFPLPRA